MFKLALNAGHGYMTAGKRCLKSIDPNETREYVLNKRICDKIENILSIYDGISILRIDDGSEMTIAQRTAKANSWGADFYLAVHHNASINGGNGGGIEVYVYTKVDDNTLDWQNSLYEALIRHTDLKGNRANPLRKANLGECRETKMSAVLLELGFMDSKIDTPIILTDDFANKCANACVEVIVAKANLKLKVAEPIKVETSNPTVVSKSITEIAKEVISGHWGNGAERKANLEKAGYDFSSVQKKVNELLAVKQSIVSKYFKKYEGNSNSFVDALKSLGINSSLSYRGKIAKANGIIKNATLYVGLKSHNEKMFALLKKGKLIKP